MPSTRYADAAALPISILTLILVTSGLAHGQEQATAPEESVPALCDAAYRGDLQEVRVLLRKGVSADTSIGGTTALMKSLHPFIDLPYLKTGPTSERERRAAAQRDERKIRIAMLLLASGANVRLKDRDGATALHDATFAAGDESSTVNVVRELLRRGAAVDARTLTDVTPLQLAVANKRFEVARVLVKAGASLDARDSHGKSAADELVAQGSQPVLDDLRHLAARPH